MKKYLLDTSICVFLFRDNHDVAQRLNKIGRERCFICVDSRGEDSRGEDSRGDRYLSHNSRHTQVPVPATTMLGIKNGMINEIMVLFMSQLCYRV